jgi:hypothetical protein
MRSRSAPVRCSKRRLVDLRLIARLVRLRNRARILRSVLCLSVSLPARTLILYVILDRVRREASIWYIYIRHSEAGHRAFNLVHESNSSHPRILHTQIDHTCTFFIFPPPKKIFFFFFFFILNPVLFSGGAMPYDREFISLPPQHQLNFALSHSRAQ